MNRTVIIKRDITPFNIKNPEYSFIFEPIMKFFHLVDGQLVISEGIPRELLADRTALLFWTQLFLWKNSGEKLYYVSESFYKALTGLKNSFTREFLTIGHNVYIILPKNKIVDSEGTVYNGVFISTTHDSEENPIIKFCFESDMNGSKASFTILLKSGETMDESIERSMREDERKMKYSDKSKEISIDVTDRKMSDDIMVNELKVLTNVLLYINSDNAKLFELEYEPKKPSSKSKTSGYWNKGGHPVTLVNHEFHLKNQTYHVDKTTVQSHFRWQPFGPGRNQMKLIEIEEHERHYK